MNDFLLKLEPTPSPVIKVHGEEYTQMPHDLYIPPDALRVFLETFEGPLDLLLYLIKKQNFDILDIPIAEITKQYVHYIDLMQELQLELAAEYLVMAAMLAEIKSRLLLPRLVTPLDHEEDPRAELVRRLQEYERFQQAAQELDQLPRVEREIFIAEVHAPILPVQQSVPAPSWPELLTALRSVLQRASMFTSHQVIAEVLSVRVRMTELLARLQQDQFSTFIDLFDVTEGRNGVVVTLLAVLELIRQTVIEVIQAQPFATIYIRVKVMQQELIAS